MTFQTPVRARLGFAAVLATLLAACALGPAGALAALPPKGGAGALSPALTELAKPSVRSQSRAEQAKAIGVARSGPGSLIREGERVFLNVRFAEGATARLGALRDAGASVVSSSRRYQTVTVAAAPAALHDLAAVPGVASVWASREPLTAGSCEGGAVISEGLGQLKVDQARAAFGLRGAGVTVGVLSDSFDTATEAADGSGPVATHATQDAASNDLPGGASSCSGQQQGVDVLDEGPPESGDEGRAMLQIVHDLAPHSPLAFATAFQSEASFAQNIERLAEPTAAGGGGAQVVVDDVAWFEEPFFQDGPVAVAVNNVTEAGANYLTSAGNDNLFDSEGHEIASWEAPAFRDSANCPAAVTALAEFNGTHCMDFEPEAGVDRTFGIAVQAGATLTLDLQWAEPWFGVNTDLDAFLLNAEGKLIAASYDQNSGKGGTQRPVEIVQWTNGAATTKNVFLAINRYSGAADPRLKFILLQNGGGVSGTEYPESKGGDVVGPSIFGHAGAASAISVAAVPYSNSAEPEPYSSRGPVTHYFGPVEGIVPAEPLISPEELAKPDLAATDCGATTFFAHFSAGAWRFCGTSAAAPHAAAVTALLRQGNPTVPASQVREVLTETTDPVGAFPPEAVGSGLVNANAALAALPEPIEAEDPPSVEVPPLEEPEEEQEQPPVVIQPNPFEPVPQPQPVAPNTFIKSHPPKLVRTAGTAARLVFRFGSDQAVPGFLCKVDRARFRACGARFARSYSLGAHAVRVKARGATGMVDSSPSVFRFRVERLG